MENIEDIKVKKNTGKWETTKWVFTAIPLLFLSYVIGYTVLWVLWGNMWLSIFMWVPFYFIHKKYGVINNR